MDEAKAALAEARRLNPAITVKWMKEHTPNLPAVLEGLRKAGLPADHKWAHAATSADIRWANCRARLVAPGKS